MSFFFNTFGAPARNFFNPARSPRPATWANHTRAVETLRAAGIAPPPEWSALHGRYFEFIELPDDALDKLAAAVITGTGDLGALRAAAYVDELAQATTAPTVNAEVQRRVLDALVDAYAPAALANFKTAAARFDAAAKAFTAAAKLVDLETSAEQLVTIAAAGQRAWLDAPQLAADLEQALTLLCAAAALAGADPDTAFVSSTTEPTTSASQIALAVDAGRAHRRKIWLAWERSTGRTGRWGALHSLGVSLRAASDPTPPPYQPPESLVAVRKPGGALDQWDPYDGPCPDGWFPLETGWLAEKASRDALN